MKIAYFDCFSGASGDMILGSLLDAGLSLDILKQEIAKLGLSHYEIGMEKVVKKGIGGTQAMIHINHDHHHHHHRHLSHIRDIINTSELPQNVKEKSIAIFQRLAEAEARVHRSEVEHVHFHEVGAMDAIIDVTGAVIGFNALGIEKIYCSPLHVGCGTIECAHGVLPVPAPATAELIKGRPAYSTGVDGELLTPTGAAILTTLSSEFGSMPSMSIQSIGYGAGTSEPAIPNLLRLIIGETGSRDGAMDYETEQAAVMETNIDDMNPQIYDYLIGKILEMGAMDVFLSSVQMKKNRPGILLTLVCSPDKTGIFSDFLLRETTTIGLRWRLENRIKAYRKIETIETIYGPVRIKTAESRDEILNISPEYDDCRQLAVKKNIPLKIVIENVKIDIKNKYGKK
ncbi:Pyridinium-3,5-bisthiocarboxylic acid mononucleotide nickel insertion protein [Desulfonema limicola]|uniref:Putative nickel insertion protein n=1 Tax=Desulfonema limicola TaxID=45656 RepID=A0A975B9M2_9BACT|nr:nickel pincer cofactor biosynthesis protein LarC [Desulfonema limicola]QTA81408.1 Pyridinium-3,5-bisthiocarboxylic acid mononucleotide nickel insertion protein [Desulfonema limicola]